MVLSPGEGLMSHGSMAEKSKDEAGAGRRSKCVRESSRQDLTFQRSALGN
jgi:hypothetical protein